MTCSMHLKSSSRAQEHEENRKISPNVQDFHERFLVQTLIRMILRIYPFWIQLAKRGPLCENVCVWCKAKPRHSDRCWTTRGSEWGCETPNTFLTTFYKVEIWSRLTVCEKACVRVWDRKTWLSVLKRLTGILTFWISVKWFTKMYVYVLLSCSPPYWRHFCLPVYMFTYTCLSLFCLGVCFSFCVSLSLSLCVFPALFVCPSLSYLSLFHSLRLSVCLTQWGKSGWPIWHFL